MMFLIDPSTTLGMTEGATQGETEKNPPTTKTGWGAKHFEIAASIIAYSVWRLGSGSQPTDRSLGQAALGLGG